MRKIRKAVAAAGLAGALNVGALITVPPFADSDDATVDQPPRYEQVVDDADEAVPSANCTGTQQRDRDRDQLRVHMQDRDCDGVCGCTTGTVWRTAMDGSLVRAPGQGRVRARVPAPYS